VDFLINGDPQPDTDLGVEVVVSGSYSHMPMMIDDNHNSDTQAESRRRRVVSKLK